jgi:hypothetical protein
MSRVTTVFMRIFAEAYIVSGLVRYVVRDMFRGKRSRQSFSHR